MSDHDASPAGRFLACALLVAALVPTGASAAEVAKERPTVLPEVKVNTEVPLLKIGNVPMLEARAEPAVATDGRYLYIVGGSRGNILLDSVERFDPVTGRSEIFAQLKAGRRSHRAAVVDGRLYAIGGFTRIHWQSGPAETVEVIDLATAQVSPGVRQSVGQKKTRHSRGGSR